VTTTPSETSSKSVRIERLSAKGDGLAIGPDGLITIPQGLPGELVSATSDGAIVSILEASPERRQPFCPVYDSCGGCATQHMTPALYTGWKHEVVQHALTRAGFDITVDPVVMAHGRGRRRVVLHVRFQRGKPEAGFMAPRSHRLVQPKLCPILVPELAEVFPLAEAITQPLAKRSKPLDVQVIATETGLDVDIRGHGKVDHQERMALIGLAGDLKLARLSIHRDVVVELQQPLLSMGQTRVHLPSRAFLQATAEAEHHLAEIVSTHAAGSRKVADLFCGIGPFALRLTEAHTVYAADETAPAIAAMVAAHRRTQGLKPLVAEARDLFRRPLLASELSGFDAVITDPPRAGCEAQMREIGLSKVRRVISVSCDLASFLRDADILKMAGFRLEKLTPVDQFAWSRHIELVGLFTRS
jgi:23S rRNA (uracil1939-C5)-methyltransferase